MGRRPAPGALVEYYLCSTGRGGEATKDVEMESMVVVEGYIKNFDILVNSRE